MTLTPLRCDRRGHKDQSARWARPAVAVLDVEVLLHAALKQSWGVRGGGGVVLPLSSAGSGWGFEL